MQFDDVFVLEDVVAGNGLAVVAGAAPDPGVFELFGEIFVDGPGEPGQQTAARQ